jgi:RHS repeat-associated protein
MTFDPEIPYDKLPLLPPPTKSVDSKKILRQETIAREPLAELKGLANIIPNQAILINTLILQEAKDSSGQSLASFTYDHRGRRKSKTTTAGTINYHYDNRDLVVYETDENNNLLAYYTYDDQGNPVTMTRNGSFYYYHLNGHGDIIALTDENGNVVAEYKYDAWGNILSQTGTMATENPYRYAGYRYDDETGLYYLMARYYDAATGRFITADPYRSNSGKGMFTDLNDPLSRHHYVYARNNPVMYIDLYGEDIIRIGFTFSVNAPPNLGVPFSGDISIGIIFDKSEKVIVL